jgi:hypothetical protein
MRYSLNCNARIGDRGPGQIPALSRFSAPMRLCDDIAGTLGSPHTRLRGLRPPCRIALDFAQAPQFA